MIFTSGDDEVRHEVELTRGFWLGKYEVTQREWIAVMGTNPSSFPRLSAPVEIVSWNDVMDKVTGYCVKLTEREQKAGRLPPDWKYTLHTEAQWEYACRAGTETPFSNSKIKIRKPELRGKSKFKNQNW